MDQVTFEGDSYGHTGEFSAETVRGTALGHSLLALAADQSEWSQATFGTDAERGPVGALRHLAKEAVEAVEAWEAVRAAVGDHDPDGLAAAEKFNEELADCLLLLLDASRRGGLTPLDVVHAAQAKMKVNRTRTYARTPDGVPSEHLREAAGSGWWVGAGLALRLAAGRVFGFLREYGTAVNLIAALLYLAAAVLLYLIR